MSLGLSSLKFDDGGTIPAEFTCKGDNVNPPLMIEGVPEDAVSLLLIVDDPDSPSGDFVHWMVWNIPANTTELPSGELPESSIEGYNDFGNLEYGGPCPPSGEHEYHFRLYALDIDLELDEDTKREKIEKEIAGHILDETVLVGVFG